MGGNGPSRLSAEDGGGGGVTFVRGIRLSDRVINRMKGSSVSQGEGHPSPETQTATPVPAPPVEGLLPLLTPPPPPPFVHTSPTAPSAEPVKLIPPPPVKFHSLPPSSVAPPPTVETQTPPNPSPVLPPPPSTPPPMEPVSSSPPAVVLPPPETFFQPPLEPESPSTPPAAEHIVKAASVPPPVETCPSELLPPSFPSEHVKPAAVEPAAVDPAVSETPSTQALHPPATVGATAADIITPPFPVDSAPVEAEPPQVEPPVPPAVVPAVDSTPACELAPPPPPPESSPSPELTFEESSLPSHCAELAVLPADAPVDEPVLEPVAPPPPDPVSPPEEPTLTPSLPPVEDEAVTTVPLPAEALPVSPEVLEENLRQKIREEMQRSLEEEINQRRQELQRQLEEMRAQAQAEAEAAAQAQVEELVKKTLAVEKEAYMEKLTDAIMKERMKTEDEHLLVQLYWMELKAYQLEEREKELQKRDALYKEHVSKLEAKCTEFYKVTAESFQQGKEETHKRFARFSIQPVCGDLQSQILKCYKENTGRTLSCSRIASAYMQCVDNAKKNKLSIGG